jgi:hypothetical protein
MGIAAVVNIIGLLAKTGLGKNVTERAKEALGTWQRPWWLSRRFVGAVILVAAIVIGRFTGQTATDGDVSSMVDMVDKAVPYLMSYGAALGIFGFTNRDK